MPDVVVLGGGPCGLAAGLLLARDGHDVTLLERDPAAVPETSEAAWERWERVGVRQFRQPHILLAGGREVLAEELPDVLDAIVAARSARLDPIQSMPPGIADRDRRAGDERFATVTARRPVLEAALARAAGAQPRLEVRRGAVVAGLDATVLDGRPHVRGVRLEDGDTLRADLVVDASGRRSSLPAWLQACGAAAPADEAEDSGFLYYSRFFRAGAGGVPVVRAPIHTLFGSFSILTLPADDDTWSVTVVATSGDAPLKRLRHADPWRAVVAACPLHAHWLDGTPITDVVVMAGAADRRRSLQAGGAPVATGVVTVADAWACTNPSNGRGLTMGLRHARALRDHLREQPLDPPAAFTTTWEQRTDAGPGAWYRATVREDRGRLRAVLADRGEAPAPMPAAAAADAPDWLPLIGAGAGRDPDAFRAMVAFRQCLELPEEAVATRPGLADRLRAYAASGRPRPLPGPERGTLLQLVS